MLQKTGITILFFLSLVVIFSSLPMDTGHAANHSPDSDVLEISDTAQDLTTLPNKVVHIEVSGHSSTLSSVADETFSSKQMIILLPDAGEIITPTDVVASDAPPLIISEIMYNPASSEDDWEWIEIYNAGSTTINLAGYVLDDNNTVAHSAANIASGSIMPGQTAVLFNDDDIDVADFEAAWGTGINLIGVTGWSKLRLNNSSDGIGLWDSFASYSGDHEDHNNTVVNVEYDDSSPWPTDDNSASIYLTDLNADFTDGNNWALSQVGTSTPTFIGYQSTGAGGNNGSDIGSPGPEEVTSITLMSFTATPGAIGVTLTWVTGTETDNAGFNLHRAITETGPFTQINPTLIPAKGDAVSGASYSYLDTEANTEDVIYHYKLEDIDTSDVSTFHGPVDTSSGLSGGPGAGGILYLPLIIKNVP